MHTAAPCLHNYQYYQLVCIEHVYYCTVFRTVHAPMRRYVCIFGRVSHVCMSSVSSLRSKHGMLVTVHSCIHGTLRLINLLLRDTLHNTLTGGYIPIMWSFLWWREECNYSTLLLHLMYHIQLSDTITSTRSRPQLTSHISCSCAAYWWNLPRQHKHKHHLIYSTAYLITAALLINYQISCCEYTNTKI
jgi:hypothetical protein